MLLTDTAHDRHDYAHDIQCYCDDLTHEFVSRPEISRLNKSLWWLWGKFYVKPPQS